MGSGFRKLVLCMLALLCAASLQAQTSTFSQEGDALPLEARQRLVLSDALETTIDENTYVLGPGDLLAVAILLGTLHTYQLPVLPEGVVVVPQIGVVNAAGSTLHDFRAELRRAVAGRYRTFDLYCHLAQARQFRVFVTGEVKEPGTWVARPYERVSDLIERASGFTDTASRRAILVRDANGELVATVDLDVFYRLGDLSANPHVAAGQVIVVPPRLHDVDVQGAVVRPGRYELLPGETLSELVALAGGPLPQADLSAVQVDRLDRDGVASLRRYDLQSDDPLLEDAVRVAVLSKLIGKPRVYAILPDNKKYTFFMTEGETLADLVRRTGEVEPDVDFQGATLATQEADGSLVHTPVDITRVLAGQDDRPLRDGDLLAVGKILTRVFVSGHVAQPGPFFYRADWTVNDYVGAAGGTTAGGNLKTAIILDRDGNRRKVGRGAPVVGGDTIHIDRSTGGKFATAFGLLTNVSALVISIVALTR